MPTAPRLATRAVQFFYTAPAIAAKIKSFSSKAPRDLLRLECLFRKLNPSISPGFGPEAENIELIARLPPVWGGFSDVSSAAERETPLASSSAAAFAIGRALTVQTRNGLVCGYPTGPLIPVIEVLQTRYAHRELLS
jgi:hypothetical protein